MKEYLKISLFKKKIWGLEKVRSDATNDFLISLVKHWFLDFNIGKT